MSNYNQALSKSFTPCYFIKLVTNQSVTSFLFQARLSFTDLQRKNELLTVLLMGGILKLPQIELMHKEEERQNSSSFIWMDCRNIQFIF